MGQGNVVLDKCYRDEWITNIPNSENCSGFLKSLGKRLGVTVPDGKADDILAGLPAIPGWIPLGAGEKGLNDALRFVFQNGLVLVGVTSQEYGQSSGHVAVLLPRVSGAHLAPLIYGGGSAAARSAGTKTLREVFRPSRLGIVRYFRHATVGLGKYE